MIDLLEHIFPHSSAMYSLVGAGSDETCVTQYDSAGYAYFRKNENSEEGFYDAHYVYRAFDISNFRNNEVYCLWTRLPGGTLRYGSAWTPRTMNEGQVFKRSAYVRHYDAQGNVTRWAEVVTWIKLVKYHASRTFASGRTVQGVAELQYGFSPDVKDVREHYFYGKGYGLVGFEDGVLSTYIGQGTPTTIKPQTVIPWINALRPPMPPVEKETLPMPNPYIPPPDTGARGVLHKLPGSYTNIREQPYADAKDIGNLKQDEPLTYAFSDQAPGWAHITRASDGVTGWVSLQRGDVAFAPELLPVPEPEPAPSKHVIYAEAQVSAIREHLNSLRGHLIEISSLLDKGAPSSSGGGF